jgi:hypothetical protein
MWGFGIRVLQIVDDRIGNTVKTKGISRLQKIRCKYLLPVFNFRIIEVTKRLKRQDFKNIFFLNYAKWNFRGRIRNI